jgi:hypothetical protein
MSVLALLSRSFVRYFALGDPVECGHVCADLTQHGIPKHTRARGGDDGLRQSHSSTCPEYTRWGMVVVYYP